jgi:hypothetical protein
MPCGIVEFVRHFRTDCCLHLQGCGLWLIIMMMEAEMTPETSVNFHQATWRNLAEDGCIRTVLRESLKSHQISTFLDKKRRMKVTLRIVSVRVSIWNRYFHVL